MESETTRCGTIVLVGFPNVGKSTLFNTLVGEPLAIVSGKPQTTRLPVIGIRTESETQLVFVDPPGLLQPKYLLQERMLDALHGSLRGADAVLQLHEAGDPAPPLDELISATPDLRLPPHRLVVWTQIDRSTVRLPSRDGILPVSAVTGEGVPELLDWCRAAVPAGAFRYDPASVSTQPIRFFAEEFVREAAFELLQDELPYAVATETEEFRENDDPVYIRMTIHVERDSQKGIIVGHGGRTIRAIGSAARQRIERLLGCRVYLDLRVKVLPKWRTRAHTLRRLGFPQSSQEPA